MYTDSMDGMDQTDVLLDGSLGDGDHVATEGGIGSPKPQLSALRLGNADGTYC